MDDPVKHIGEVYQCTCPICHNTFRVLTDAEDFLIKCGAYGGQDGIETPMTPNYLTVTNITCPYCKRGMFSFAGEHARIFEFRRTINDELEKTYRIIKDLKKVLDGIS
jgi:C4-type Zn-finger protein